MARRMSLRSMATAAALNSTALDYGCGGHVFYYSLGLRAARVCGPGRCVGAYEYTSSTQLRTRAEQPPTRARSDQHLCEAAASGLYVGYKHAVLLSPSVYEYAQTPQ